MKVNIGISEKLYSQLNQLKSLMLMDRNILYVIQDFSVEEILVNGGKTIFGKQRPLKKKLILTNIDIRGYNNTGKFFGFLGAESCKYFLINYDLYRLRNAFTEFQEQLKAFGFEIKKIDSSEIKA